MDDPLFHEGELAQVLRRHGEAAFASIQQIAPDRVLAVPVEDLVEEWVEECRVNPVTLRMDAISSPGARDSELFIEDAFGRQISVPATRVEFHVPFTGDARLFKLRPLTYTLNPPRGDVREGVLVLTHKGRAPLNGPAVKAAFDGELEQIQQYLRSQRTQIDQFNWQLEQDLRTAIEQRRQKVLADRELDAALEIPIQRRTNPAASFTIDPPRRPRPAPTIETRPGAPPYAPEPVISEGGYAAIVGEIASFTAAVERLPNSFAAMPEESLRDVLLVVLNNRFGPATGETFSRKGKTDIFIPYEGDLRTAFIAECKWWTGATELGRAVDQLLGYLIWRDSKAALVVFTDRKDPVAVIEKARAEIQAHPHFKRTRTPVAGQWAAILRRPDDPNREIHLSLVVVPVRAVDMPAEDSNEAQ